MFGMFLHFGSAQIFVLMVLEYVNESQRIKKKELVVYWIPIDRDETNSSFVLHGL